MRLTGILGRCAAALLIALGGCGGSDTAEPFEPTRMFAFGDELSVMSDTGAKYTVNAVGTGGALDCTNNPLWIQVVGSSFGFVFPQCNPNALPTSATIYATPGATVADVTTQVDAFLAAETPSRSVLATMLAGMNDVLALYAQYPAQGEDALVTEAAARGKTLAEQANRIANAGAPVVVVTVPDMGKTPSAIAAGADAQRVLSRLSASFNSGIHINLVQDGRLAGIVFGEAEVQNAVKFPSSYSYTNVTDAACTAELPACTTQTVITNSDGTPVAAARYLWADGTRPGPTLQARLGQLALARARNNPF